MTYNLKLSWYQRLAAFFSKKKKDRYDQNGLLQYFIILMKKAYYTWCMIILKLDQYMAMCPICRSVNNAFFTNEELSLPEMQSMHHINCGCIINVK